MSTTTLLADLACADSGSSSARGPALLLIHGAGGTHLHWPPALRAIPGRRVVALDLPGHGASPGPALATVEAMAHRVLEVVKALGPSPVVLGGHSLGGAVAQAAALEAPERVAGLVLVATGARLRVAPAVLAATADPATLAQGAEAFGAFSFGPGADAAVRQAYVDGLLAAPPGVLHTDLAACDAFDVMDRLPELRAPGLVVCGTADQLTPPRYSSFLRDCLHGSRLVLVPGAGHLVMLEAPEAVAEAVEDFLQQLEDAPPP